MREKAQVVFEENRKLTKRYVRSQTQVKDAIENI